MALTRIVDRALEAMFAVEDRFPDLAARYESGSPKRAALEEAMAAVAKARQVVFAPRESGLSGAGASDDPRR